MGRALVAHLHVTVQHARHIEEASDVPVLGIRRTQRACATLQFILYLQCFTESFELKLRERQPLEQGCIVQGIFLAMHCLGTFLAIVISQHERLTVGRHVELGGCLLAASGSRHRVHLQERTADVLQMTLLIEEQMEIVAVHLAVEAGFETRLIKHVGILVHKAGGGAALPLHHRIEVVGQIRRPGWGCWAGFGLIRTVTGSHQKCAAEGAEAGQKPILFHIPILFD